MMSPALMIYGGILIVINFCKVDSKIKVDWVNDPIFKKIQT